MKLSLYPCLAAASLSAVASVQGATFLDATGDSSTSTFLDITSVVVNNTASTLSFQINLAGDPTSVTWNKYMIGLDTVAGGNTTGPDGWGKPISMSVGGMDYHIGAWTDSGGGTELRHWDGSAWPVQSATYNPNPDWIGITLNTSSVTISLDYVGLGLSAGNSFHFDIYTTSDGNSVLDAAGTSAAMTWNNNPYDSGANVLNYTIAAVPEPGMASVLALGALALVRRQLRR